MRRFAKSTSCLESDRNLVFRIETKDFSHQLHVTMCQMSREGMLKQTSSERCTLLDAWSKSNPR